MNNEWTTKINIFEQQIFKFTQENNDLQRRINELLEANRVIPDYENKLNMSSQEIQRLTVQIEKYSRDNQRLS